MSTTDFFSTAQRAGFKNVKHDYHEETGNDPGRIEIRRYWITDELSTLPRAELWKGLRSIGRVERECWQDDKVSFERRYFISSIDADAHVFSHTVRRHWDIENKLHWRLDVIFREDDSWIRKSHSATIMATVRHLCLNLLQQETSRLSIKKKRRKAAWDDGFRTKILSS